MSPKNFHRLVETLRWMLIILVLIISGYIYNWNENYSPWGKQVQATKLEMLKNKLCN